MNNPIIYIDPSGNGLLTIFAMFLIGAGLAVTATLLGDVTSSVGKDKVEFPSWQTYVGNMIGGGISGALSLIPGFTYVSVVIGSAIGTFVGNVLNKLTGNSDLNWGKIGELTAGAMFISMLTAGIANYIPKIFKQSGTYALSLFSSVYSMNKFWKELGWEYINQLLNRLK